YIRLRLHGEYVVFAICAPSDQSASLYLERILPFSHQDERAIEWILSMLKGLNQTFHVNLSKLILKFLLYSPFDNLSALQYFRHGPQFVQCPVLCPSALNVFENHVLIRSGMK